MKWKVFLTDRKIEIVITVILFITILIIFSNFLLFIEERHGVVLPDPILNIYDPIDLTWLIFGLIYLSLSIAIISFVTKPDLLFFALQSYSLLLIFRMIVMYVTPLEAPDNMLSLNDPFVQFFGTGNILTKDLFFSGHTATLFLFFLIADKKHLKVIFLIFTSIVAFAVLLQHVHYTVDIVAAPIFAYVSYRIIKLLNENILTRITVSSED
ncbi:MAG: phosphatase PAP2-related protein [Ignavibacteria bacterium]|nr:phosphatase PAP2-related protein [Ignavibacteria bacterium]